MKKSIDTKRNPLQYIVIVPAAYILLSFVVSVILNSIGFQYFISNDFLLNKNLFIFYFLLYGMWWRVYFKYKTLGIHNLRDFLTKYSYIRMKEISKFKKEERELIIKNLVDKSDTTMKTVSVFTVAVSFLLTFSIGRFFELPHQLSWELGIIVIIIICWVGVITLLFISIDSLDSVAQIFSEKNLEYKNYFYRRGILNFYRAVCLIIFAVILLVSYLDLLFTGFAVGLFVILGFRHWFITPLKKDGQLLSADLLGIGLICMAIIAKVLTYILK